MRLLPRAIVPLAAAALLLSAASVTHASNDGYQVQVLRTSYGIPHVKAADWGSLGYGYGYAFAQDNVCVLAREVLAATGTQSRWFGSATLASDFVYAMVNAEGRVSASWETLDADLRALITGYADGYNRYLRDTGSANLPADCRAEWVRPLTARDVLKVLRKLMVRAGTGNFVNAMVAAQPPVLMSTASPAAPVGQLAALTAGPVEIDPADLPDFSPERFGSNAVALGSQLTGGSGALLGNPHFPWYGIQRFYGVHLTIPGRYDVMGASIYGFPLVNIGFNRHVAWSHTVSTARRFVLRELTLVADNPTSYLYEGEALAMQPETVAVDVLQPGVGVVSASHTFWMTRFGPVVVPAAAAAWTPVRAYALTDVNLENLRAFRQYREMGTARNLDEFARILRSHVGLPWVNTVATDSRGQAFYGDLGAIPNVTAVQLAACVVSPIAQALSAQRLYTLDGTRAACDPGTDPDAPAPGIFGAGHLPSLVRRDFVQNSNSSYWLANPAARLEGFSPVIGADENRPQNFRTRLGVTQVRQRQAGTDGLPGEGFDRQWLQDVLFANRHYSAEIALDDVLGLCATESRLVMLGGETVDVTAACGVLAAWDRRNHTWSTGAHVWTELWRRLTGAPALGAALYAVAFDPADPVNTPRGINVANAGVRTRVMGDLAATVKYFAENGIALAAPWGAVHFDVRNGEVIPIHGGSDASGVYNAMQALSLVPGAGYTPIVGGSSYIQAVTFTPKGPDARAVVTYSQSSDPANPHYADMTKLFSNYGWVQLPFEEGDIRRDPNLQVLHLSERR